MTSFGLPLADVLKEWRIAAHITLTQAARRSGISRQLWFQLETGESKRPLRSTVEKVSKGTGIPVGVLEVASYIPWPRPFLGLRRRGECLVVPRACDLGQTMTPTF
jgi:transcriptional regulator with XRE-family HTH domain